MKLSIKHVYLLIKIITFPVWWPFWLLNKGWRILVVLFLFAMIAGCVSSSNKFDKSPCACEFVPVNASSVSGGERSHA